MITDSEREMEKQICIKFSRGGGEASGLKNNREENFAI